MDKYISHLQTLTKFQHKHIGVLYMYRVPGPIYHSKLVSGAFLWLWNVLPENFHNQFWEHIAGFIFHISPFFVTPNAVHANQIVEMENLLWLLLIQTLTTRCVCIEPIETLRRFITIRFDSIQIRSYWKSWIVFFCFEVYFNWGNSKLLCWRKEINFIQIKQFWTRFTMDFYKYDPNQLQWYPHTLSDEVYIKYWSWLNRMEQLKLIGN